MTDSPFTMLRKAVSHSLSAKLMLIIMLLAAPVFLVSMGLLFIQSRSMIRQEALGRARSELGTAMQRMGRYILAVENVSNAYSMFVADNLNPDSILTFTRNVVALNPDIDGCSVSMEPFVFPEYGRYYSAYSIREYPASGEADDGMQDSITTVVEKPYNYFNKKWYKAPRTKGAPCWVDYFDDTDSLDVVLSGLLASYGMPVYDADGRLAGILSTDISLTRLSDIISQDRPYPSSYFMMLDDEGHYLVHPDTARLFTHTIFDDADPHSQADVIALGHEMTKGSEGSMFLTLDGVPSHIIYKSVPGISWHLALVCPDSDILVGHHKQTYILFPLLLAGLLFIVLLCSRAVAVSIRPLSELVGKTQSIAAGNMEAHIPHSQRIDAVGRLQNSFASMLQRLNFHMGSVRYSAEQARQQYEELAQTTRMTEEAERQKTAFIQNVSHQIRTPLNIIMGFAQILSSGNDASFSSEELKGITATMNHNSKLLTRMVLMLFDSSDTGFFEELNSNKHDCVACNDVARESVKYVNEQYPDIRTTFETEVADDFCIQTSHLYLVRSLRELLYNAARYSDGKNVKIKVALREERHTVCFIVEDTGKGISVSDHDLMFKFFAKADDLSEGLGLGLPLAKRHMLNLGGDLTIDTGYHDGCRFVAELPVAATHSKEA